MAAPFKAYDVRGIYGEDVNEELAYKLGRAYVAYTGAKNVVVGRDMRPSGVTLQKELVRGLRAAGANVTDIGMASTDMMYFAVISLGVDGGISVTASHNPGEYNGFKFVREKAIPMGLESGLDKIEALVRANTFPPLDVAQGSYQEKPVLDEFVDWMHSFVDPKKLKPQTVVIDAGNGMGGPIIEKLFAGYPGKIIPLFFEPDGTFPNHEANPLVEENRRDLIAKVKETNADLGVGLDGDTDRAFFVDGDGRFIDGDFILGLLAKPMLKQHPNAKVVYDVRCSDYVRDTIKAHGGEAHMWKVGHAYAKTFMREIGAEFGGEVSGHYYFRYKDAYFDSGNLTVLLLMQTLSDQGQSLAEAMEETRKYHISGEINSRVSDADKVMADIKQRYAGKGKLVEIDGLSIIGDGWWFNIRKSNTEPLLRLNCEAKTQEAMEKLRDELLAQIRGQRDLAQA
ncbi:MAG TPA: phosphomannomutase/phosphoglucomutase [Oscillatoriaceae cyanobacterium]